jgi:hypothetical protein
MFSILPKDKLLLPSSGEWSSADNDTKRATVSYVLAVIGTVIGVVGLWLAVNPFFSSQQAAPHYYDLSQPRRAEFLELLSVPPGVRLDTLRIGCVVWSEASCVAAGKFMILLSEAGWRIDGRQVYRMEPTVPVEGISIVSTSNNLTNLPKLPPHLGRWAAMGKSASIIGMAFRYMDSSVHYSSDPSLGDHMLGIYFGPDAETTPILSTEQKSARRPLMVFLRVGLSIESHCGYRRNWFCASYQYFWEASVSNYLSETFSSLSREEWLAASKGNKNYPGQKIEKQQNFLINSFLGVSSFQQ